MHPVAPAPAPAEDGAAGELDPLELQVGRLDAALTALDRLRATDFDVPEIEGPQAGEQTAAGESLPAAADPEQAVSSSPVLLGTPWKLSQRAVEAVAPDVRETVQALGMDLAIDGLPRMLQQVHAERVDALSELTAKQSPASQAVFQVGGAFLTARPVSGYVGDPATDMPTGQAAFAPLGSATC